MIKTVVCWLPALFVDEVGRCVVNELGIARRESMISGSGELLLSLLYATELLHDAKLLTNCS